MIISPKISPRESSSKVKQYSRCFKQFPRGPVEEFFLINSLIFSKKAKYINTAKQAPELHQQLRVLEHKTAIRVDIQKISSCGPPFAVEDAPVCTRSAIFGEWWQHPLPKKQCHAFVNFFFTAILFELAAPGIRIREPSAVARQRIFEQEDRTLLRSKSSSTVRCVITYYSFYFKISFMITHCDRLQCGARLTVYR